MDIKEKSENFNSLRPILFELCKKTTGGSNCPPPPSGNRVNIKNSFCVEIKEI